MKGLKLSKFTQSERFVYHTIGKIAEFGGNVARLKNSTDIIPKKGVCELTA